MHVSSSIPAVARMQPVAPPHAVFLEQASSSSSSSSSAPFFRVPPTPSFPSRSPRYRSAGPHEPTQQSGRVDAEVNASACARTAAAVLLGACMYEHALSSRARQRRRHRVRMMAQNGVSSAAAGRPGAVPNTVEVVSWNVLSSHLSKKDYYWHNKEDDLDPKARLQRVLRKLEAQVERGAVICLQEVSTTWSSQFHVFFQQRGYHMVYSHYGNKLNGYMGVAVAFPNAQYELRDVSIQRISETVYMNKAWAQPNGNESSTSQLQLDAQHEAVLDVAGYFSSPHFDPRGASGNTGPDAAEETEADGGIDEEFPVIDHWAYSRSRQNTMVAVKLSSKDRIGAASPVVVATYHMPCAYFAPPVMVIHAALAAQYAFRFAAGDPVVLAGDFNFKPGAAPYQLLTAGSLPANHRAHPGAAPAYWHQDWRLERGLQKLKSAYESLGREPQFTNYAWVRDDTDPFVGTLDYIFVSTDVNVVDVGRLPDRRECPSPLPTQAQPSDHLMVSAVLRPKSWLEKAPAASEGRGLRRPTPMAVSQKTSSPKNGKTAFGSLKSKKGGFGVRSRV
eukprot:TRINITY_DN9597_c0_g1_i1.p1 TRINITY_DN9597_c0_g1~~TRINITY_DN9597_c0_g1_i1.p1  ORF type:complete len:561 (+),score=111.84 TRINITY_DN9597_c0_g1_i1:108-1790(+)